MRIALLGDVMLGRLVNEQLKVADPVYPWGDTLPVLRQADIRFANLECVLADGGTPVMGKTFHFRSDVKNAASLRSAAIDVVSLANNHVLDYGVDALREMLPALDQHGILRAGAGMDAEAARQPAVRRVGPTAVGFLAFTDNEPAWEVTARSPGIHYVPVDAGDQRVTSLGRGSRSGIWNDGAAVPWDPEGDAHCASCLLKGLRVKKTSTGRDGLHGRVTATRSTYRRGVAW